MYWKPKILIASAVLLLSSLAVEIKARVGTSKTADINNNAVAVLWREPADIASRNLFFGPGGEAHVPRGKFTFKAEDMAGTSPKFDVIDEDGASWRVKMGCEARPETVASRLVWAVGYFANEDYFMPALHVEQMQRLRRGRNLVSPDNTVHNVRLKRRLKDQKKIGAWSWSKNPFTGTREWYGLRVLMAVMNNWDLKDINNSIYQTRGEPAEDRYMVSDLGASFGPTGLNKALKGKPDAYYKSKWIKSVSPEYIDFNVPSGPAVAYYLFDVYDLSQRFSLEWLGHHIPRKDARWMGDLLARLSPQQIRDAFRASGYSADEVEQLTTVLERRIGELEKL